ncbi:MAG: TetR/AcrR family transcriptional regulator [Chloroflexota bacterium]
MKKQPRKLNRQVLRTRKLLQEALIDLVQEQDFDTLKIQDITDRANLGRATFYMHYKDKEDLLAAVVDQFRQELEEQFLKSEFADRFNGLLHALKDAKEKPELFRVVFSHHRTVERIRSFVIDQISSDMEAFNQRMGIKSGPEVLAKAHIMAGSIIGTFNYWLNHQDDMSAEELADMFQQFVLRNIEHPERLREIHESTHST